MGGYQPPFVVTPLILNQVIEIGELMGHWAAMAGRTSPLLRKENRIRTIQASLAIEHNSLTTEQVTALMEGKRILAPAKDIQEVRNAILAYEKMSEWKSERLSDLLQAHQVLMFGLVDNPGQLRSGNVGVYREKQLIHMALPASQVPRLVNDLLGWLKTTEHHPLIAGAVFHYEFEFIHPFSDGNGRMGRLWQTLILREWRTELAWLPVETLIYYQQDRYYQVLGQCDRQSSCTPFIEFILGNIISALKEGLGQAPTMSEEMSPDLLDIEKRILQILSNQPGRSAKSIADECEISARTVERYLKALQQKGKLQRVGAKKGGMWRVKN
ncbi:Fic family protein [Citrobacter sp. HN-141]|uniref:Fic family protein n=1 Tax=unclassified Citrobacter TaxID=2644389 RepID=UPI002964BDE5|nr:MULTISPECIES: Fic family protein [unclassified Citrobacter]MDW2644959.1 Fic family protein [Citrobacter sp. HN-141]MDW2654509.1 Fic family protein [Citrobacter sp. HN-120]MDW2697641.1 Fic family protein [Citrobacter sp. HN-144]